MNSARLPTFLPKYIKGFQERETFFSFFLLCFHILAPPLSPDEGEGGVRGKSRAWREELLCQYEEGTHAGTQGGLRLN